MNKYFLILLLCICTFQVSLSQVDDGIVAFNMPLRNSLTFNRYTINPTFSFVREQNKYISISNKREWVQFENAPLTYLASYSGRFGENIGAGIGVFQQNYGVLTTFGGILNFAYNVELDRDSNLTFGLNIGAYKSGLNTGSIVVNFDDPSIENVPENFLLTVNPGINYGTGFFDFGVSLKNIVAYNLQTSLMLEDNPEQGIQAHLMYTGYFDTRGFFDETKFSGLIKSEFTKDKTIISGLAMWTVPKGIWGQIGYNTLYGASAGLGLNITNQIAIEYNFEKAIGDLTDFGPSHEISLAYRFKNKKRYYYSGDDEISSLLSGNPRKNKRTSTVKVDRKAVAERKKLEKAELEAKRLAKLQERENLKAERLAELNNLKENKAKEEADAEAARLAQQKAKEEADAEATRLAQQKAKEEADAEAARLAEQKAKEEADAEAARLAQQKAKEEADAEAARLAEQKAKEEADAEAARLAQQKAKEEADAEAARLAQQKAKEEADAEAARLAQQKAKEEADAEAARLAEQKAKEEADAEAARLAQQKAKEEADAEAARLAQQKAKEEADAEAARLAEQKAKEEADAEAARLAQQKAKEETKIEPITDAGKELLALTKQADKSKDDQDDLLQRFEDIIQVKDDDLKTLKEENDLVEQGIAVKQRAFKSITEENNRLNRIKLQLETNIAERNEEITNLKKLYEEQSNSDVEMLDNVNLFFTKKIKELESEQALAINAKSRLEARLEDIKISTEFEKRRSIKRATFVDEGERYEEDRAALKKIKETTTLSNTPLTEEDFDFGEKQNGIEILKNINREEKGFYLVLAVHTDVKKRDEFLTKAVQAGRNDINFFYDVNTSKYYIYYDKYNSIQNANKASNSIKDKPYNKNMSIVKIE
ncbi:PorP/SprF family type IX secretion system membrane protein [Olleya sp. YSTF-M6]|uniref:PorP/SprF family type IX secretion system membrane protein n=1 Tax=Olleya sediminilitoris TaxID=2795739 RepID=A0ABS1WID1_9FLAO|nr:type IX secretion system membrane protein PorP/SprF [Olleya sediminilitoris]MBL7558884.1 PorP/SprF family type IX secretion system membrane protein [Olleya sediminilitoris]